ncbi:hypothetical protein C8J57DRAFT_1266305 [Mycena rebaudengoi]|nr:hypothetical protein C8J57DRAFT_1266305 [Mycena rebaudengoi]
MEHHHLSEIDEDLVALRRERQDNEDITQHLATISPIRYLPYDILAEIFSLTLPTGELHTTDLSLSPWVLTRVCIEWRNTATSLPALWASICIDRRNISLGMLKKQLERSGSFPLTITLKHIDLGAFKMILEHSDRWHTVDLRLKEWMIPLLNKATGYLPLLRSLTYHGHFLSPCNAFETAPRLDQVTVKGGRRDAVLAIPYRQLLRLRQYMPRVLHTAASLRLAHNLTRLTLVGMHPLEKIGSPIELPHLQMLHVIEAYSYLDSLVLPALEDIFILQNILPLVALIRRSSCSLRKLGTLDRHILAVLEHVPTLSELHCQDPDMGIVSGLAVPDPSSRPLCPELRSLAILFDSSQDIDITCSKTTQLMESRHRSALCPPLSVRLYEGPGDLTPHALETYATLRQRGMDIQWFPEGRWDLHLDSLYDTYP